MNPKTQPQPRRNFRVPCGRWLLQTWQNVREILENNGVQSMEQYQKLMGEMDALFYVEEELTSLLQKQEQIDD